MPYKNVEDQRAASHRHYVKNRQKVIDRAKVHNRAVRDRTAAYLREAKSAPCADCGQCWPYYVMHFDHISDDKLLTDIGDDKLFNLGEFRSWSYSFAKVQAEVAKCEVVCANCHAIRTYERRSLRVMS